jgi:hypothetical protein
MIFRLQRRILMMEVLEYLVSNDAILGIHEVRVLM